MISHHIRTHIYSTCDALDFNALRRTPPPECILHYAERLKASLTQVSCGRVAFQDLDFLRLVSSCPRLTTLDVRASPRLTFSYKASATLPNLTSLNLSDCVNITDGSMPLLARLCPNLSALLVAGASQLTDQGIHALCQAPFAGHQLHRLDLHRCDRLTDEAVLALARYCGGLQWLRLPEQLTLASLSHMASATRLAATLEHLDFVWRPTQFMLAHLPPRVFAACREVRCPAGCEDALLLFADGFLHELTLVCPTPSRFVDEATFRRLGALFPHLTAFTAELAGDGGLHWPGRLEAPGEVDGPSHGGICTVHTAGQVAAAQVYCPTEDLGMRLCDEGLRILLGCCRHLRRLAIHRGVRRGEPAMTGSALLGDLHLPRLRSPPPPSPCGSPAPPTADYIPLLPPPARPPPLRPEDGATTGMRHLRTLSMSMAMTHSFTNFSRSVTLHLGSSGRPPPPPGFATPRPLISPVTAPPTPGVADDGAGGSASAPPSSLHTLSISSFFRRPGNEPAEPEVPPASPSLRQLDFSPRLGTSRSQGRLDPLAAAAVEAVGPLGSLAQRYGHHLREVALGPCGALLTDGALREWVAHGRWLTRIRFDGATAITDEAMLLIDRPSSSSFPRPVPSPIIAASSRASPGVIALIGSVAHGLTHLSLRWCPRLSDAVLLVAAYGCPHLESCLSLRECPLLKAPVAMSPQAPVPLLVSLLEALPALRYLDVARTGFGADLAALGESGHLARVRALRPALYLHI
ncbi:hypothetical protein PAPYR_26 [Paratrimastix pyriformis]|uniref:F-box/LRR-repeat protein 15-like leucin rich repeat domain-containing protein n=1 Tax=Paratrimastix pyriformis TaxID=342808 RepID=A0ABQ8UUP3_9EUKA|nr:hypothetical protein PAPYR_26 [Paratrimastix pyriformis]